MPIVTDTIPGNAILSLPGLRRLKKNPILKKTGFPYTLKTQNNPVRNIYKLLTG
jgi:hypothetical protein